MSTLRRKAETKLKTAPALARCASDGKTPQELAHEVDVRGAERDLQTEQLRRLRAEFEVARRRYAAVFDASRLAYLTLDAHSRIVEANVAACELLGVDRDVLVHKPLSAFMEPDEADAFRSFREHVVTDGAKRSGEILIHGKGRAPRHVLLTASFVSQQRRARGDAYVCVLRAAPSRRTEEARRSDPPPPSEWSDLLQGIASCASLALDPTLSADHTRELVARARDLALRGLAQRFDERRATAVPHLRGTVLVVEDDPSVRTMLREQLVGLGLTVVEAPDAEQAARLFERARPDLVLTNVRLPRTTGPLLVERMRVTRPDLPVVFVSDDPPEALDAPVASTRTRFLRRPFVEEALAQDIEALLTAHRRPSRPSQRIPVAPVTAKIRRRQADGTTSDFAVRGYSPRAVARQVMRALEDAAQERGRGIWSSADPEVWIGDALVGRLSSDADAPRLADAVLARLEAESA